MAPAAVDKVLAGKTKVGSDIARPVPLQHARIEHLRVPPDVASELNSRTEISVRSVKQLAKGRCETQGSSP
jgi:hypothetical protein